MKIYTKIGDKGTTRLVDGSCVDKFNPKVVAYGTVDELNAFLGQLILVAQQTVCVASAEADEDKGAHQGVAVPASIPVSTRSMAHAQEAPAKGVFQVVGNFQLPGSNKNLTGFFNESVISVKDLESIQHHLFRVGSCLATADESVLEKMPAITESHIAALEQKIDLMQAELPVLKKFILPGGNDIAVHSHLCRTICRRAERETVAATLEPSSVYQDIRIYLNRLSDFFFVFARYANHVTNTNETHWDQDL